MISNSIDEFEAGLAHDLVNVIDLSKLSNVFNALISIIKNQGEEIRRLNNKVEESHSSIGEVSRRVDTLSINTTTIESQILSINEQYSLISAKSEDNSDKIVTLLEKTSEIDGKANTLFERTADLDRKVTDLSEQISSLSTRTEPTLDGALGGLSNEFNSVNIRTNKLMEETTKLIESTDDLKAKASQWADLIVRVSKIQDNLNNLVDQISIIEAREIERESMMYSARDELTNPGITSLNGEISTHGRESAASSLRNRGKVGSAHNVDVGSSESKGNLSDSAAQLPQDDASSSIRAKVEATASLLEVINQASENSDSGVEDKLKEMLTGYIDKIIASKAVNTIGGFRTSELFKPVVAEKGVKRGKSKGTKVENDSRRTMDAAKISIPAEKRHKLLSKLRMRGYMIISLRQRELERAKNAREHRKNILTRVANLEAAMIDVVKLADSNKRTLERVPIAMRKVLPDNFNTNFNNLVNIMQKINYFGGIDKAVGYLKEIEEMSAPEIDADIIQDSLDNVAGDSSNGDTPDISASSSNSARSVSSKSTGKSKGNVSTALKGTSNVNTSGSPRGAGGFLDANGRVPIEFIRAIRKQIGHTEPNPESPSLKRIEELIENVKHSSLTRKDLDDVLYLGEGNLRPFDPHAVKLKGVILTLIQKTIANGGVEELEASEVSAGGAVSDSVAPSLVMSRRVSVGNMSGFGSPSQANRKGIPSVDLSQLQDASETYTNNATKKLSDELRMELQFLKSNYEQKLRDIDTANQEIKMDVSELKFDLKKAFGQLESLDLSVKVAQEQSRTGNSGFNGDLNAVVRKINNDISKQQKTQSAIFEEVSEALQNLNKEMSDRPDKRTLDKMIAITESTFTKQLGTNVVGIKQAVGQVVKAVQQKASIEEVAGIISTRVSDLEAVLNGVLEDDKNQMAAAYKCLSCGHSSLKRRAFGRPENTQYIEIDSEIDDEYSIASSTSTISASPTHRAYSALQGQIRGRGGNDELVEHLMELRSKQGGYVGSSGGTELGPVQPPPSRQHRQYLKKHSGGGGDGTPLYRRSQKANYLKELVKAPPQVPTLPQMIASYHFDSTASKNNANVSELPRQLNYSV